MIKGLRKTIAKTMSENCQHVIEGRPQKKHKNF